MAVSMYVIYLLYNWFSWKSICIRSENSRRKWKFFRRLNKRSDSAKMMSRTGPPAVKKWTLPSELIHILSKENTNGSKNSNLHSEFDRYHFLGNQIVNILHHWCPQSVTNATLLISTKTKIFAIFFTSQIPSPIFGEKYRWRQRWCPFGVTYISTSPCNTANSHNRRVKFEFCVTTHILSLTLIPIPLTTTTY